MISWSGLVGNALWICGLSICLAALSMAHYQARAEGEPLRSRLGQPESHLALAIGMTLFCVGLLLSSATWWQKGMWGLGAACFLVWAIWSWKHLRAVRE